MLTLDKQVFPDYEVVGWYAIGREPDAHTKALHAQISSEIDAPYLMLFAPTEEAFALAFNTGTLPLTIYEERDGQMHACAHELATSDTERIVLDDLSRLATTAGGAAMDGSEPAADDDDDTARLVTSLLAKRTALSMLYDKLEMAQKYVEAVRAGKLARDPATLRLITTAVANQSASSPVAFGDYLAQQENDTLLRSYLAALTDGLSNVDALVDLSAAAPPRLAYSRRVR